MQVIFITLYKELFQDNISNMKKRYINANLEWLLYITIQTNHIQTVSNCELHISWNFILRNWPSNWNFSFQELFTRLPRYIIDNMTAEMRIILCNIPIPGLISIRFSYMVKYISKRNHKYINQDGFIIGFIPIVIDVMYIYFNHKYIIKAFL